PAVALALRAKTARIEGSFNFRRGKFALQREWANLKGKCVLLAAILGMSILIFFSSLGLGYFDKAGRAEQIQTEMANIYRSLFPDASAVVDVPLQLRSAIRQLQEKDHLFSGGQFSALTVLSELSRLVENVSFEIQECSMSGNEVKLSGWTTSFEAANRLTSLLEERPMFNRAQVTDAKMSIDGNRINFRLLLSLSDQGEG
ncbi:MAG: PilN domain-containing protein, partial [Deltaproteobacteria bacterium]|nr:PilN domain-containing protein [Deltaproteobacteria bacterium]